MRHFIAVQFELVLCILIFVVRAYILGIGFGFLAGLTLRATPLVGRWRLSIALISLLFCLVPYYSTGFGIDVLVIHLLMAAASTAKIWFVRTYGLPEYRELLYVLARKSKLEHAIACMLGSAFFTFFAGFLLFYLCPDPTEDWGYWFGVGIMSYAAVIAVYGTIYSIRLFRIARRQEIISDTILVGIL